jgi:N-acetylmuramoyl-L-alanine amidase
MTTINESLTAKGYTPAALVPQVFGRPRTIEGIVIHHWGATGQRHQDVVNFFVNGPGETSAHFVVSAGRIDCLVSPLDAAWHCPGKNATHIGIECHPEATDADYATVAELVNFLRATYGPLPLSMHRDWYNTACPGIWNLPRIDQLAAGSAAVAPQSTPTSKGLFMTLTPAEEQEVLKAARLVASYLNAPIAAIPGKVWAETVLRGGKNVSVKQELADAKTAAQLGLNQAPAPAAGPAIDAHQFIVALGNALPKA